MKIAIIEDNTIVAKSISKKLKKEGYEVNIYYSFSFFMEKFHGDYAIYIIDLNLGDGYGFEIISYLRKKQCSAGFIIVTSSYDDLDKKLLCFDLGADDYMTKPFSPQELIAKINSLAKRIQKMVSFDESKILFRNYILDKKKHTIVIHNKEINFSKTEFEILILLIENIGSVLKKDKILEKIRKHKNVSDNTIHATFSKIRKKLGKNIIIESVKGKGYYIK